VGVPSVVGQPYESAASQLQAAGFAVARRDVDSDQPKNNVVAQDPAGGASAARGATVTLSVSKGPKTSSIPDVTSQDEDTARATLEDSGFRVSVQDEDTTDPASDGLVLSQDPPGGTQAKPGTTVTIVVGRLVAVP
jgi:eukaryotic-like serine/threonine-protein kinase